MIKGAIFDVDGVILDSMPVWRHCGLRYLKEIGVEADLGLGLRLFNLTIHEGADYLKEEYNLSQSHDEIVRGMMAQVENFYFNEATPKEGALELLEKFHKAGIRMSVATSTSKYCIDKAFEKLGIADYFDVILSCTEFGKSKEHPDIFFEAVSVMKTPIESTWLFEDGLYSMKTAKKEGFRIAGVYDQVSHEDQDEIRAISDIYMESLKEFQLI